LSKEEYNYGYRKLIDYERYLSAMDSAGMDPENVNSDLIVEILEKAATKKAIEPFKTSIDSHDAATLFKELDKRKYSDEKKMIQLEWIFMRILSDDI